MNLGKKYKVESDNMNITVLRRHVSKKDKKEAWTAIGYFSNVKGALKFIVDLEIGETGMREFEEVVKKQDEIYKLIDSLKEIEK